jgi:DNA mismatch repair ATPase MutS
LGLGNKGVRYRLCRPSEPPPSLLRRILRRPPASYTFEIAERDESGARALADLRGRGINAVANALAQSVEHVLSFFHMLQAEVGFYVACLNLYDQLTERGLPVCWPAVAEPTQTVLTARALYDPCLGLRLANQVVANDVDADNKRLIVITGANQGGKTTFLRSLGLAQLMMQAGMFVAARHFAANLCDGVFTHFPREEDRTLQSGKLDEELRRLSQIVDHLRPGSLLLCNESLASTNEREGTEIARPLVLTLLEAQVKVFYVTHFFRLAHGLYESHRELACFLRAERQPDGQRSFKLVPGAPLPTSYGADLYHRVFGQIPDAQEKLPVSS